MSEAAAASRVSRSGAHDLQQLIAECDVVLQADPTCLHTRAVRGHACMKAQLWAQAVRDFSALLRSRPADVHGRFSRGMALFRSGHVARAHQDFSRVLELNPNHVMARYARAGCFNSEGAFQQAIHEYVLALQNDDSESAACGRLAHERRGLHGSAGQVVRQSLGGSTLGPRSARSTPCSSAMGLPQQHAPHAHASSTSRGAPRPRQVRHVRVNLSAFAPSGRSAGTGPKSESQEAPAGPPPAARARKPARKVTVAL